MVNCNFYFIFKELRIGSFYMVSCFLVKANSKLDVGMQSIIRVIIYDAKRAFKNFMILSVTKSIV